jgi:hypothetical protein
MFSQSAGTGWARHMCVHRALHRVVLDDHARLPWRFFGRLTAAVSLRG